MSREWVLVTTILKFTLCCINNSFSYYYFGNHGKVLKFYQSISNTYIFNINSYTNLVIETKGYNSD